MSNQSGGPDSCPAIAGLEEDQPQEFEARAGHARQIDEKVGLVVVHGIGEQEPGDHLEGVVKPLANAIHAGGNPVLIEAHPPKAVSGVPAVELPAAELPAAELPAAELNVHKAPAGNDPAKYIQIGVHEVHWADINEAPSIGKGLRFWLWGLSAWLIPSQRENKTMTYKATLAPPRFPEIQDRDWRWAKVRLPLLLVGWMFAIAAPSIVAANFLAKRLFGSRLPSGLTTIVNYVSAVKLYSQPRRHGDGHLASAVEPPRYTIRRRMARSLADMALAGYDRWYVLAHSQGTVVAFNGLMNSSPAFAAYLDDGRLAALEAEGMAGPRRGEWDGPEPDAFFADRTFRPPVPPHRIGQDRIVYRDKLFDRFCGFISYGSPLDKFAAIWPPTVSVNRDIHAFNAAARWINVYDPTDPVSAPLDAFQNTHVFNDQQGPRAMTRGNRPQEGKGFEPENVAYPAWPILLWSHVRYLSGKPGEPGSFAKVVGDWLLGSPLNAEDLRQLDCDAAARRKFLANIQVLAVMLLFSAGTTALACYLINLRWPDMIETTALSFYSLEAFLFGVPISLGVVLLLSVIGWLTTEIDIEEGQIFRPRILATIWRGKLARRFEHKSQSS